MAGPVDQNLPHGLGSDAEEVAVIGIGPVADEPKVGLVHKRGRVERVIGPFPGHLGRGQFAQLVVNQLAREQMQSVQRANLLAFNSL